MCFSKRTLSFHRSFKNAISVSISVLGNMFPTIGDVHLAPFTDEQLYMEQFTKANFWWVSLPRNLTHYSQLCNLHSKMEKIQVLICVKEVLSFLSYHFYLIWAYKSTNYKQICNIRFKKRNEKKREKKSPLPLLRTEIQTSLSPKFPKFPESIERERKKHINYFALSFDLSLGPNVY